MVVVFGSESENLVDMADDGEALGVREFAIEVFEFCEGGAGLGAGVAIFLELHGFLAGAGQGVEQAGESGAIAAELFVERLRSQIAQGLKNMEGAELEGGVIDFGSIEIADELAGGFLPDACALDEGLLSQPIPVTALFPTRKVDGAEAFAVFAEALDNGPVSEAVPDHGIDLMADVSRQAGDIAVVAPGALGKVRGGLLAVLVNVAVLWLG